jgi:hypothetical protein
VVVVDERSRECGTLDGDSAMISMFRAAQLRSTNAGRWYSAWASSAARVYVVRASGLRFDSEALGHSPTLPKRAAHLAIPLEGGLLYRRSRREVSIDAGSLVIEPGVPWNERWISPSFRVLVIDWNTQVGPSVQHLSVSRLSVRDRVRLSSIADAIEQGVGCEPMCAVFAELDALLRSLGVELDSLAGMMRDRPSSRDEQTAAMLSHLRSRLWEQPAWIDGVNLAGRSERQLRRDVRALLAGLAMDVNGLRTLLATERVLSAASLLSSKGARVHDVARSVGFGTSRALALALDRAGLPTATALAANARDD